MQMAATAPTFASTYAQFLDDLKGTFPEYAAALTLAASLPDSMTRFVDVWRVHTASVAASDASIFDASGVELVPGFIMTTALWTELSENTHAVIWKYLRTLLLLAASTGAEPLWDISGFQTSMEEMMRGLRASAEGGEGAEGGVGVAFAAMFAELEKMAAGFGLKTDLSGASPGIAGAAAAGFKVPERLFKGHIARIVEELVKEFKPEDFGITEEMMSAKDPKAIFTNLQEIFTKKPEMLMAAGQKIAKKLQAKFASGAIKREEIITEVEELMKEFSDNEQFSELFGSLGDMLKSSDRATGNEHSSRLRETRERMRKKAAEKEARRAAAGAAGATPINTVVTSEAAARAAAAEAALLMEDEEARRTGTGAKKQAKKR
jgi:hypothetical protein